MRRTYYGRRTYSKSPGSPLMPGGNLSLVIARGRDYEPKPLWQLAGFRPALSPERLKTRAPKVEPAATQSAIVM